MEGGTIPMTSASRDSRVARRCPCQQVSADQTLPSLVREAEVELARLHPLQVTTPPPPPPPPAPRTRAAPRLVRRYARAAGHGATWSVLT